MGPPAARLAGTLVHNYAFKSVWQPRRVGMIGEALTRSTNSGIPGLPVGGVRARLGRHSTGLVEREHARSGYARAANGWWLARGRQEVVLAQPWCCRARLSPWDGRRAASPSSTGRAPPTCCGDRNPRVVVRACGRVRQARVLVAGSTMSSHHRASSLLGAGKRSGWMMTV
jgi:hypothetical protein